MNEESKENIINWINQEKRIKTLPLTEIGYPCRLVKNEGYKSPLSFKGLEYTQELENLKKQLEILLLDSSITIWKSN